MKRLRTALFLCAGALGMAPSAAAQSQEPSDPRGPYSDAGAGNLARAPSGTLEILLEPGDLRGGSRQVQDARRPRIRITNDTGRLVREVVAVSPVEGRTIIDLPPGEYLVEVASPAQGRKTFRTTVVKDRWTVVDPDRVGDVETWTPSPVRP